MLWLSRGGMEAIAVDHARTDKGDEAANCVRKVVYRVGPLSRGRGWHVARGRGRGRSMCCMVLAAASFSDKRKRQTSCP